MRDGLEFGVLGTCVVCGQSTPWWHRAVDRYHAVHPGPSCRDRFDRAVADLEQVAAGAALLATGPRRGAWARRGLAAAEPVTTRRHGLSRGSPFHRPGMPEDAPWVAVAETNLGQFVVSSEDDGTHARAVLGHWRLLTERGLDVAPGGRIAVGAVLLDPAGAVVDSWGDPVVPGSPRWRPVGRVADWTRCVDCGDVLWPGCLATVAGGACVSCTAAAERDDPRVWPDEPSDPGPDARPAYLGGARPRRRTGGKEVGDARARAAEVSGGLFADD